MATRFSKRLRSAPLVGMVGATAVLVACGSSPRGGPDDAGPAADGDGPVTVTFGEGVDLESQNPYAHSSSTSYGKWRHVIEPLVDWNYDTLEHDPVLAESWEMENDTTWVFHLREDVTFSDGSPLTADDVIHSFTRIAEDPESRQAANMAKIDGMEAVDKSTVRITTDGPYPVLLNDLTNRFITSKASYDELGAEEADKVMLGTGPYTFKEWVQGTRLVFEKRDDYWGEEPVPDTVVFRPIPEDAARVAALERGEVDAISNLPPQDVERVDSSDGFSVVDVPSVRMAMFPMNPAIPPFDDVKVRQAVSYAIDREALRVDILGGYADLLPGPVQENVFGFDPDWEPYPYDPEKAEQLLAEAGYPDGGPEFTLYTPSGRYLKDLEVSQAICGQLAEVGITCEAETMEWGSFAQRYDQGEFEMYHIGRGGLIDAADVLTQYFRTGDTTRIDYSNPEVDDLLNASDVELDPDKRADLIGEAGKLILADAPAVFFATYRDIYGIRAGLDWTPRNDESMHAMDVVAVQR